MFGGVAIPLSPEQARALEEARRVSESLVATLKKAADEHPEHAQHLATACAEIAASTLRVEDGRAILKTHSPEAITSALTRAILTKSNRVLKADQEERYILGIVLEPLKEMGKADSQGDTYSAEEVRKAAYTFMEEFGNLGEQHQKYINGRVKIRENWITRDDSVINGQVVKAGTWLLGVHVIDDDLWDAVKEGKFTGFSIGGYATTTPVSGA